MAQQWQSPRPQHRIPKGGRLALGCGGVAVVLLIAASCGAAIERNSPATAVTETVTVTVEAQQQRLASEPAATVTVTVTATAKPKVLKKPKPKPSPKPQTTSKPAAPKTDPRFGTCGAANAAGYGPYYRGQDPEYAWYIDRDGDGIVCER